MLLQQFPELTVELAPGRTAPAHRAPAPPPPPDLADRLREERAEALLLEQRHGLVAPGHSAAPLRLHISDTIRDITDGVVELEEAVRERLGLSRARRVSVPERLRRIAGLLDEVAADAVLAAHVRDETRRMARRCAPGAGGHRDGRTGVGAVPLVRLGLAAGVPGPRGRALCEPRVPLPGAGLRLPRRPGLPAHLGRGGVEPMTRTEAPTLIPGPLAAQEAGVAPATIRKWVQLGA
jgi:hypothetical protein